MSKLYQEFEAFDKQDIISDAIASIPKYIAENLHERIGLREYQKKSLLYSLFYLNYYKQKPKPSHLLFHMATGSGKTVIMACLILELYKQGYRNFIFFVNSTNIIEKTKDNFLNQQSIKYLFSDKIRIADKEINIRKVDNFDEANSQDINIHFTTIQGLHSRLNNPSENAITYEDFDNKNLILISDEAHHLNTLTKSKLNKEDIENKTRWEYTVQKIFNNNPKNLLLEFTATMDTENKNIAQKYDDKIIFEYSLKNFREDKFSKEVNVLQADLKPIDRAFQSVILSQYRRKMAEKNGVFLKPVILMKSKTIHESEEFYKEFTEFMANLSVPDIEKIKNTSEGIIKKAFDYFKKHKISHSNLIKELKQDFSEEKCISVNCKSDSEDKQIQVNTLENYNNEVRVIFAVDMLNEGWDVLNLFDIVRLYETRDSGHGRIGETTIKEAQLIGRGARYFPFIISKEQEKDKRKYDDDLQEEKRILEELYYHSSHNPKYISEIKQALIQTGIWAETTRIINHKLKTDFKSTDFWKNGIIYLNKKIENTRSSVFSFDDVKIPNFFEYQLKTGKTKENIIFKDDEIKSNIARKSYVNEISNFSKNTVRTAISKLDFFRLNNLKKYFPNLQSINEFITSSKYLKNIKIEILGLENSYDVNSKNKVEILIACLQWLENNIKQSYFEFEGTKEFNPISVRNIFKDKILKYATDAKSDKELGKSISESSNADFNGINLMNKKWFAYEDCFGSSEEKYFIKYINDNAKKIKQKYDEFFLIRNERLFKIYNFNDGKALEPDFVLFLKEKKSGKELIYQLFIEPKGSHLIKADKWKEYFLKTIEKEHKIITLLQSKDYKLIGLPFYNESMKMEFDVKFKERCNIGNT